MTIFTNCQPLTSHIYAGFTADVFSGMHPSLVVDATDATKNFTDHYCQKSNSLKLLFFFATLLVQLIYFRPTYCHILLVHLDPV